METTTDKQSNAGGAPDANQTQDQMNLSGAIGKDMTSEHSGNPASKLDGNASKEKAPVSQEIRKLGSFPEDLSTMKQIFSIKSKNQMAKDRYSMKASEYLETHKMSIYLQDSIKIILDRKEQKPLDLLAEYFNTTLKGDHILLREYAFVSATCLNRKCFLQQLRKVFHAMPFYNVITGLDYHQMICLICSDFPRNQMIETIQYLPVAKKTTISEKEGADVLFEQYDLHKLQAAVCIFFYYKEFMDNVKGVFQEAQGASTLNPKEEVSLFLIYSSINNLVQRLKSSSFPLPPIEAIVEVLLTKTDAEEVIERQSLVLISDTTQYLSGNQISYIEFVQGMKRNKSLLTEIYEPIYNKRVTQMQEQLKQIAAEQAASVVKEQKKKDKGKKMVKQGTK